MKSYQVQICKSLWDIQLWYNICLHLILFERTMNFYYGAPIFRDGSRTIYL